MNTKLGTNIDLAKHIEQFIKLLETLVRHKFNKIIFVDAEDSNKYRKSHRTLYDQFKKYGIEYDIREYKDKVHECTKCHQNDGFKV